MIRIICFRSKKKLAFSVPASIYTKEAILLAAKEFTDDYYVSVDGNICEEVQVFFQSKKLPIQSKKILRQFKEYLSLYSSEAKNRPYHINNYRKQRIAGKILLTSDFGTWVHLKEEDYKKFLSYSLSLSHPAGKILKKAGFIITEENTNAIAEHISDYFFTDGPGLHIVVLTLSCNLQCSYCLASRRPLNNSAFHMNRKTAKATADFILSTPQSQITVNFTGGEPLLNFPVLKYFVTYMKKKNTSINKKIRYTLSSNGTIKDKHILKFCRKNGIYLSISLDGPAYLHNKIRQKEHKNTYNDVMCLYKELRKDNGASKNFMPVVTKKSLRLWKENVDHSVQLGVNSLRFKYLNYLGEAVHHWNTIGYTPEEFLDAWKKTINYMLQLNEKGLKIKEGISLYILAKIFYNVNPHFNELDCPCGAVRSQLLYNHDGSIFPCYKAKLFPVFKLGEVFNSTYNEIVTSPTAKEMITLSTNLSFICDACPWYSFCGTCLIESYSRRKNPIPDICSDFVHKINQGMISYLFERILSSKKDAALLLKWVS